MGYTSGRLNEKVEILERVGKDGDYGRGSAGAEFRTLGCVSVDRDFNRGAKSMREGALDAYDVVMFRMRWNPIISRESYLRQGTRLYTIESFNADYQANQIQITAREVENG